MRSSMIILAIFCIGCLALSDATYISDRLLGKLAPPVIFLGGAYGTAAAGAAVGYRLASRSNGHGGGMGGLGRVSIGGQSLGNLGNLGGLTGGLGNMLG